jgi:hypothetical protein
VREERGKSRRYPRVVVGTKIKGQTHGIERGTVLNLSVGGALIEHAKTVRPGIVLHLVLNLRRRETRVRCRVVWSTAHRAEAQPDGQQELIYHTGVEFLDPSVEIQ